MPLFFWSNYFCCGKWSSSNASLSFLHDVCLQSEWQRRFTKTGKATALYLLYLETWKRNGRSTICPFRFDNHPDKQALFCIYSLLLEAKRQRSCWYCSSVDWGLQVDPESFDVWRITCIHSNLIGVVDLLPQVWMHQSLYGWFLLFNNESNRHCAALNCHCLMFQSSAPKLYFI